MVVGKNKPSLSARLFILGKERDNVLLLLLLLSSSGCLQLGKCGLGVQVCRTLAKPIKTGIHHLSRTIPLGPAFGLLNCLFFLQYLQNMQSCNRKKVRYLCVIHSEPHLQYAFLSQKLNYNNSGNIKILLSFLH